MTELDKHGRTEPPIEGDESATLRGFLNYQRATFEWKCSDLDESQLRQRVAASSMTLGGMMKHMAIVEEGWFSDQLWNRPANPPWDAVDWESDRDWEWHSSLEDSPDELRAQWHRSVGIANAALDEALGEGALDQLARKKWQDGRAPSLRWIMCHMIEEYARHNGHADLIRESIDGQTGE
jgi:uncharacterized damage-inducible protein DinB